MDQDPKFLFFYLLYYYYYFILELESQCSIESWPKKMDLSSYLRSLIKGNNYCETWYYHLKCLWMLSRRESTVI